MLGETGLSDCSEGAGSAEEAVASRAREIALDRKTTKQKPERQRSRKHLPQSRIKPSETDRVVTDHHWGKQLQVPD